MNDATRLSQGWPLLAFVPRNSRHNMPADANPLRREERYILSTDGKCELYHHTWKETGDTLEAVVCIVHGMGEHCHRYDRIVSFLTARNIRVYSFDHRGHGRTHMLSSAKRQGHRGHIHSSAEAIAEDIALLLRRPSDDGINERIPRFLLGHSLGGLFSIHYGMTRRAATCPAGIILLAPAIGIMHPPNVVLRSMAPLGAWLFPAVTIDGSIHSRALSRLPEVCAAIEADPLMHRKISFGTGNVVLAMGRLLDETAEPEIPTPCLFIHGTADSITDCAATEAFFDRLKCPRKTLHLHQGGYHKPHDDLGSELVFGEIDSWINSVVAHETKK